MIMLRLGKGLVYLLGALAAVNAVLLALIYGVIDPAAETMRSQTGSINQEVAGLKSQIEDARRNMELVAKGTSRFQQIQDRQFIGPQDRLALSKVLEGAKPAGNRFSTLNYQILPEKIVQDPAAANIKHQLVSSPVVLDISAFIDSDLWRYLDVVQNGDPDNKNPDLRVGAPGHAKLTKLEVKANQPVTPSLINNVASGSVDRLLTVRAEYTWSNLRPIEEAKK